MSARRPTEAQIAFLRAVADNAQPTASREIVDECDDAGWTVADGCKACGSSLTPAGRAAVALPPIGAVPGEGEP